MGGLRKSGALSAAWGLASAALLAISVWHFPWSLAFVSMAFGFVYTLWPIMWIVFASLWLYNLAVANGSFEQLKQWMADHASGDPHMQVILVAFCFEALLEGTGGFGAPVAISAFLLLGLGFTARKAVTVSLLANAAPAAFGGLGLPIVALAAVTGLDQMKLSAMVGRQLPSVISNIARLSRLGSWRTQGVERNVARCPRWRQQFCPGTVRLNELLGTVCH